MAQSCKSCLWWDIGTLRARQKRVYATTMSRCCFTVSPVPDAAFNGYNGKLLFERLEAGFWSAASDGEECPCYQKQKASGFEPCATCKLWTRTEGATGICQIPAIGDEPAWESRQTDAADSCELHTCRTEKG